MHPCFPLVAASLILADVVYARMYPAYQGRALNFHAFGSVPEWFSERESGRPQYTGWSYYLRAFDLFKEQAISEVGWGQW